MKKSHNSWGDGISTPEAVEVELFAAEAGETRWIKSTSTTPRKFWTCWTKNWYSNEFNECGKPIFERNFFGGLGEMGKIQQNNMDNKNNVTVKLMQWEKNLVFKRLNH